jgi:LPXTG-motif cell wall-anchored protein
MTNYLKTFAFVAVASMAGMGIAVADQWDKKTIITTDEVLQLPNMMLQPGTYVIKLADSNSNRHIVQFFDKDEKHLVTTVLAIPNQRLRLTGKSVFAFWEVPAGQPKALRAWFYPGDNFGQEFAYRSKEAATITASNNGATVPIDDQSAAKTGDSDKDSSTTAAVTEPAPAPSVPVAAAEPAPTPAPTEVATAPQQPAPEPVVVAQAPATPARTPAESSDAQRINAAPQQPDSLPKTASNMPWLLLIGFMSIVGALALNLAYRRS